MNGFQPGWFQRNWYEIVDKTARYSAILALILFVGSLVLFWLFKYETMIGIKIAVVIWIFSQIVGTLRGLR